MLMLTPEQVTVLDECEGRGERYRLARVSSGRVTLTDSGAVMERVLSYVGLSVARKPLLVNGSPVRCVDVPQAAAVGMVGEPARGDGLEVDVVAGAPCASDYPGSLFVYGTLQPGHSHWHLLAPHTVGSPRAARLAGSLYDTGFGYPALALGRASTVTGTVVQLRAGADFAELDEYEGEDYARVRVALSDKTVAWTYVWTASTDGMVALAEAWPPMG